MVGTNKALMCFWLLLLLAVSSEEVGALDDCYPAVTIGCTKDSHCRKPCCNDDDTYTDWICRDLLCLCCKNFDNPKSCSDS
ncbi:hypothetical protein GQ55_2G391800 [Panicum hallii var. hallii]|uniref:Knottin scorpion toxin-like domain-containing protein n=2 Tax=Panicum hallii TaxID=206008 RepID=A0A2T7EX65_9POAL|nr:hypothetical protein GQ55_2G391800 [Panicum hallii var. hallii]PVH65014.1 hypothetical protein PAHAL_2G403100 [Panicum hallii]